MVTNYYNSSNNYSSPVRQKEPAPHFETQCSETVAVKKEICSSKDEKNNDKILLLGVLAILYFTECDDLWLLLVLLYLALS